MKRVCEAKEKTIRLRRGSVRMHFEHFTDQHTERETGFFEFDDLNNKRNFCAVPTTVFSLVKVTYEHANVCPVRLFKI